MIRYSSFGMLLSLLAICSGCEPCASEHEYVLCRRPLPGSGETAIPAALPLARLERQIKHHLPSKADKKHPLIILIDPGHGGEDLGARSKTTPVYSEKNFNLVTAKFLQDNLEQMGFRPILTRSKDVFIPLEKRASSGVNPLSEIFVSMHYNAAESQDAHGIEVFYFNDKDDPTRTEASKALAQAVLTQVVASTGAKSRGVKHGNYHVIRESAVPAILIEGGFLTNPNELAKIKDPTYLKKLAWGVAQGISKYATKKGDI